MTWGIEHQLCLESEIDYSPLAIRAGERRVYRGRIWDSGSGDLVFRFEMPDYDTRLCAARNLFGIDLTYWYAIGVFLDRECRATLHPEFIFNPGMFGGDHFMRAAEKLGPLLLESRAALIFGPKAARAQVPPSDSR